MGKTWTTDGFFRETKGKIKRRMDMGAVCVEMECSACAALAQFRKKKFFEFFYAGDSLAGKEWDIRSLDKNSSLEEKDKAFVLALELAVKIAHKEGQ